MEDKLEKANVKENRKNLKDCVLKTYQISCLRCEAMEFTHNSTKQKLIDRLMALGWNSDKNGNVYCPSCSREFLKNK